LTARFENQKELPRLHAREGAVCKKRIIKKFLQMYIGYVKSDSKIIG
jgi:hypothetical protein